MEQNFQTSFIPKKPIVKETAISARPVSFFLVIALLLLFTVVVATAGLYFYQTILSKNIQTMQNNLGLAQNRFEPSKITELQTLDKRLHASTEILNHHVTITPIFQALQDLTLKTVRYTNFDYELSGDNNSEVSVHISGQAIGYRSIALQSDLFAKNKNLIDPVFSNLTLDRSGNVLFDLDFTVDPSFINYKQDLASQAQAAAQQ